MLYVVKSEIIEDQNQKLEDEKKALQSQLERQMQKLQELSGNMFWADLVLAFMLFCSSPLICINGLKKKKKCIYAALGLVV